jgi:transposase
MISREQETTILRLYHAEKWSVGTIARQLGLHHGTVRRALMRSGITQAVRRRRPSKLDSHLPFITRTLQDYPSLTASRLYEMARQRGYQGSPHHFRHLIALYRPRPAAEAYLRLRTSPGEQSQVDWAHFGKLRFGQAERPLMAFVMVLSWSRAIFLRFFLGSCMENFLRGHEAAFQAWTGCSRVVLYDNLRSAVLERRGNAIRFHPRRRPLIPCTAGPNSSDSTACSATGLLSPPSRGSKSFCAAKKQDASSAVSNDA